MARQSKINNPAPAPVREAAAEQAAPPANPPPLGGGNVPTPGAENVPATGGPVNPAPAPVRPSAPPPPPKIDPPPPPAQSKKFVCTEETFWKGRRWRPGETTGDPGAEGNCFKEA